MANIKETPRDENGNPHGEWIWYFNNGVISTIQNYYHGHLHGLQKGYSHVGNQMYKGYAKMDTHFGFWLVNNNQNP